MQNTEYTTEEFEMMIEWIEMGIQLTDTIVDGVNDNYRRKTYSAIRAELAKEIADICAGTWGYMGRWCGGREQYIGIKEDLTGAEVANMAAVKENTLAAAQRLIVIEEAKIDGAGMDDGNRWIKAAVAAYRRLTGAARWADRVWDWETD